MEFKMFKERLQKNFKEMEENDKLFTVELDKDELWNLYLDSFPKGTNKLFRQRREYDCSCCRHFIKSVGNIVAINNGIIKTIWDFETGSDTFNIVGKALSDFIKSKVVNNVFVSKFNKIGTDYNFEEIDGKSHKWEHFYLELPSKYIETSRTVEDIQGEYRTIKEVFKRSLDEISQDSILTVLELIQQNSLYRGEEWKSNLTIFLNYKNKYDKLTNETDKNNYTWENSIKVGAIIGKIKNHSIGVLLTDITEGMDLDRAVTRYEKIVAPENYKRPKAIYTKKMLEDAKNTIQELGYMDSLRRRYATLDDITVNNILFANRDLGRRINGMDIFEEMEKDISVNTKKFNKVEEITIDKFINNILPTAKEVELLLENKLTNNMVSLIAPEIKDSKTMFKWNNNFSWSYSGNITDSSMKENVKSAGGRVDGDLRFSIQWNDIEDDFNDLDAHCIEPTKYEIYYGNKRELSSCKGMLDIDIINPDRNIPAVENITYATRNNMEEGKYLFFVNCYSNNGGKSGFRAEVEFDGNIYSFEYNKPMKQGENVKVAEVVLKNNQFVIKELLPSTTSSREVWNLNTNKFIPVSTIMYSPNYWDEQKGIGNKHYFFMLKDCINTELPNGMFNEYLKEDLMKHKRVFEALGSKLHVEDNNDQLSGVGFSSTRRNEVIVKVKGQTERVLKIKF